MLRQRLVTAGLLVPIFLWVIYQGGWIYNIVVIVLLTVAVWEFVEIAAKVSLSPSRVISLLSLWVLVGVTGMTPGNWLLPCMVVILIIATVWHVIDYEKGATRSLQSWAVSLIGPVYIGLLGGHLLSLRALPSGQWLTLIVLPVVWISDTGAYIVGRRYGKHALAHRTSPNKTWEGLAGGIVFGAAFGGALVLLWQRIGNLSPDVLAWYQGAVIGVIASLVGLLGDLGISLFKRQAEIKDTGQIFPGHGGVLDRIDSWLLAGAASYYYILLIALF
jgi:phosphatidate cytidylyltransferase